MKMQLLEDETNLFTEVEGERGGEMGSEILHNQSIVIYLSFCCLYKRLIKK